MRSFLAVISLAASLVSAYPSPQAPDVDSDYTKGFKKFTNVTVYTPPQVAGEDTTSYGRTLILNHDCERNNVILGTFTTGGFSGNGKIPSFPIMKSTDGGASWTGPISQVFFHATNASGGGTILQPDLYELPEQIGAYPAGTILIAGNAIPKNFSTTNIELQASRDGGYTWEYVSTVVSSGPPNTANGAPCVWEPFVHSINGKVLVHYSDQRDPNYGQKLAHQDSKDLVNWGAYINDVTFKNYTLRPGMITMAQMGNGKWITTYEVGNFPAPPLGASDQYGVHYSIANSPDNFEAGQTDILIKAANTGNIPSASPFVQWTPAGGVNGTVIVSDGSYESLFLNTQYGAPHAWVEVPNVHGVEYSTSLMVMPDESEIMIFGGGNIYGANPNGTEVTAALFHVPGPASTQNTISSCPA